MLPKPAVPEGSRMVLNGKEFWTIHNFTTEQGNVLETTGGDYILLNGELVEDRSLLELIPDYHKQKALAWWDQKFGGVGKEEEAPPAGKKMTKAELLVQIQFLQAQAELMEDEEPTGPEEAAEAVTGKAEKPKDIKESKRTSGRPKIDKGPSVLKEMGINV